MKTCNAQIEEVKDLLNNISGLAIDYDCLSGEDSMKGLIDDMAGWAREALAILEKLPRDSRGKELEEQLAEAQILGFVTCKRGDSIRKLIDAMGLLKEEWIRISNQVLLYLPDSLKEEIEEYFMELKNNASD